MTLRTAQDNAEEFGATERGEGGWNQAVLAACSCGGGPGQVSEIVFARMAGVSVPTVKNYLDGWDEAARQGVVPRRAALSPGRVGTIPLPARAFNGPGGFVKTRRGGANSTDAIMDKIKSKSGAYARRLAGDPEVLASLLEEAGADALANALGRVDSRTLRGVARAAGDEQLVQIQAEVVAGGGRVPTLDEVNAGGVSELDGIGVRVAAWGEVAGKIDAALAAAREYGLIEPDGFEAEFLRNRAMKMMDLISAGVGAGIES